MKIRSDSGRGLSKALGTEAAFTVILKRKDTGI